MGDNLEQLGMRMRHAIGSGDYNDAFATARPASMPVQGDRMSTEAASSGGMPTQSSPPGGGTIKGANGRELPAFVATSEIAQPVAGGLNSLLAGNLPPVGPGARR